MSRDSEEKLYNNEFTRRPVLNEVPQDKSKNFKSFYANKIEQETKKSILAKINKNTLVVQPKSKQINDFLKGKTKTPFSYGASEANFDNSLLVASSVKLSGPPGSERYKKEKKTIISIDSADRNIYSYPNPNSFTVNLGKTFFNVKSIKLISSEFPNSERVVKNSSSGDAQNNIIEWINEEDYIFAQPVYSSSTPFESYTAELNSGNYNINTIADEMDAKLNDDIKRLEGRGESHFFIADSNSDNGIVSLSSFTEFNLNSTNPISTIFTQGALEFSDEAGTNKSFFVTIPNHSIKDNYSYLEWAVGDIVSVGLKRVYNNVVYEAIEAHTASLSYIPPITQSKWRKYFYQGNTLYLNGVQSVGGIPSGVMNGIFTNFKVISVNTIQVYIDISCSFTGSGGGNVGVVGVSQPFQMLFGDNTNNIGRVLGFPQENSADYIREGYLTTTTFGVKDMTEGTKTTFYTQVVYLGNSISVSSGGDVTITTSIPHALVNGDEIIIKNSDCVPSIDSFITDSYLDQVYYTVTRIDELTIEITPSFDVVTAGFFCTILFPNGDNQLSSTTVFEVDSLTPYSDTAYTVVETSTSHGLSAGYSILLVTNSITGATSLPSLNSNFSVVSIISSTEFTISYTLEGTFTPPLLVAKVKYGGDKVKIDNSVSGVYTTPRISGTFLVEESTPTSFKIDFETSYVDQTTIKFGVIQSDVVTIYHPNHSFDRVIRNGNNTFRFDVGYNQITLKESGYPSFTLTYPTGSYTSANIVGYLGPSLSVLSPGGKTYTASFTGDIFTLSVSSGTFKILGTESNALIGFRMGMVDTSYAASFSGSTLLSNSTYLLPHKLYGQTLLILDIQADPVENLTAVLWLGKLESNTYTGDNSQVDYSTSSPIIFPDANQIYVDGLLQTDGVDYTYVAYSSTITFTVPPGTGIAIDIQTVVTIQVDTFYTGDGSTTVFEADDDILDLSLLSVFDFNTFGYYIQGVDYTITLPRTITFAVAPVTDSFFNIENIVNNSFMSKETPAGIIAGSYIYTGSLPTPTSYFVDLDGSYSAVNVPNTSVIRIPSQIDISSYTNAGSEGISGQPYFYNSGGLLETNYYAYTSHRINTSIDIVDTYTVDQVAYYGVETILGAGDSFKLYRVGGIPTNTDKLLGIKLEKLNNSTFTINKILSKDFYNFKVAGQYANDSSYTSSGEIYLSSYNNGFSYKQDNSGTGATSGLGTGPYSGLKLSGNNYVFLTSPGLETIVNTNVINDVFAKILLSESPGNIIFNSFVANAKIFDDTPLAKLEKLEFEVIGGDKFLYDFNNNNFSFSLEIIEYVDSLKNTGISSRTGSVDTANQLDAIYTTEGRQQLSEYSGKK